MSPSQKNLIMNPLVGWYIGFSLTVYSILFQIQTVQVTAFVSVGNNNNYNTKLYTPTPQFVVPSTSFRIRQQQKHKYRITLHIQQKSNNNDEEEDASKLPGMEEAFQQLESLKSTDFGGGSASRSSTTTPSVKVDAEIMKTIVTCEKVPSISLEEEVKAYKGLIEEGEKNDEAEAYLEMISDLGGSSKSVLDTYSEILYDLGGTPPQSPSQSQSKQLLDQIEKSDPSKTTVTIITNNEIITPKLSTDEIVDAAIQEALAEVQKIDPSFEASVANITPKSILDDDDIKKEIEAIMNEGNAKLLASLDAIRKEQELLAQESAARNAQTTMDSMKNSEEMKQQRLQNAEQSMTKMLQTVNQETANVEAATKALQDANTELLKDPLYKLKQGGLPKQLSFVGFLLFSVRSIIDTISVLATSGSDGDMSAALIQGAIAIACAVVYSLT